MDNLISTFRSKVTRMILLLLKTTGLAYPPAQHHIPQLLRPLRNLFFISRQQLAGQNLLVIEASQSHADAPHSVGLLCTSDQPVAETST